MRSDLLLDTVFTRLLLFFFFNDTATTEIYTLSLHDALPILGDGPHPACQRHRPGHLAPEPDARLRDDRSLGCGHDADRKSTRLNSSHLVISYAVFCLKKKKQPVCLPLICRATSYRTYIHIIF